MPLSDYQRKSNLKAIIESSAGATTWLALSTTLPTGAGGNVTEPSGNGYQRVPMKTNIIDSANNFDLANPAYDAQNDKYSYTNIIDVYLYEATGSWGTCTHFAIFSSKTGGTMLAYGALTNAVTPVNNTMPVIRAGDLTVTEQ